MKKRTRIIYWIATIWLSLGMLSTGIVQTFQLTQEASFTDKLHYPAYFIVILGVWKLLGVAAVLIPGLPVVKEWAYTGFFFTMSGAIISHLVTGTSTEIFPSALLLALTIVSYIFRPADRKPALQNHRVTV
jgi:hypothetical protein